MMFVLIQGLGWYILVKYCHFSMTEKYKFKFTIYHNHKSWFVCRDIWMYVCTIHIDIWQWNYAHVSLSSKMKIRVSVSVKIWHVYIAVVYRFKIEIKFAWNVYTLLPEFTRQVSISPLRVYFSRIRNRHTVIQFLTVQFLKDCQRRKLAYDVL